MKKLLYIEHIVLLLLIVHQAREFIHVHNFKSRLSKIKVANSSNAYYSEVSFWGANRFFKETRPVVNLKFPPSKGQRATSKPL